MYFTVILPHAGAELEWRDIGVTDDVGFKYVDVLVVDGGNDLIFECIACEYLGQGSLPSGGSGGGGIRIATTTTNYSAISTAVQQFLPYTPHTISFQLLDMYVRGAF